MKVYPHSRGCLAELTTDERSTLVWALEVARATLLRDQDLPALLAEESVSPSTLDRLADGLFLAGCPPRPEE